MIFIAVLDYSFFCFLSLLLVTDLSYFSIWTTFSSIGILINQTGIVMSGSYIMSSGLQLLKFGMPSSNYRMEICFIGVYSRLVFWFYIFIFCYLLRYTFNLLQVSKSDSTLSSLRYLKHFGLSPIDVEWWTRWMDGWLQCFSTLFWKSISIHINIIPWSLLHQPCAIEGSVWKLFWSYIKNQKMYHY